ncbi:MFS transporter [Flavobacterium pedocola]
MMNDSNLIHPKEAYLYSISRALERGAHYGMKGLLVLYMINGIRFTEMEATEIYGTFISAFVFAQILGGILGDFVLGNKKTLLAGGLLHAIGCFTLCIPSVTALYIGLTLIVLGSGLFTPNLLSNFGKSYLSKPKLMDAGFSILYTSISFGVFAGIGLISFIGYSSYSYGFITSGIMMLSAITIAFFIKEKEIAETQALSSEYAAKINTKNALYILSFIMLVFIYWLVYEYSEPGTEYVATLFHDNLILSSIPASSYISSFVVPLGIITALIWTHKFSSRVQKLAIGFLLGALSSGIMLLLAEQMITYSVLVFFTAILLMALAEVHISPLVYAAVSQNCNPKYLATVMSLTFIPAKLSVFIIPLLAAEKLSGNQLLFNSTALLGLIGFGLFVFLLTKRKASV